MLRWIAEGPLLIAALAVAAAGCGDDSGGDKAFDDPSFALTFEYPAEFEFADDVSAGTRVGGTAKGESKGIRLDDKNGIVLQQFDLNTEVTEANLERVKPELDRVVGQAAGGTVAGRRTTAGGLPGYEYELDVSKPAAARSRLVVLFDEKTEYTLNCQSTKEKRVEVEKACRQALDTLKVR